MSEYSIFTIFVNKFILEDQESFESTEFYENQVRDLVQKRANNIFDCLQCHECWKNKLQIVTYHNIVLLCKYWDELPVTVVHIKIFREHR